MLRFTLLAIASASVGCGLLAHPSDAFAQAALLKTGDLVRIKPAIRPRDRLTGTLVSLTADSIGVDVLGDEKRYSLTDLQYIEVGTGEKSRVAGSIGGAALGAVAGAAGGALLERATTDQCFEYCGLLGGFLGFIAGGIGGGIGGYHWLSREHFVEIPIAGLEMSLGRARVSFVVTSWP